MDSTSGSAGVPGDNADESGTRLEQQRDSEHPRKRKETAFFWPDQAKGKHLTTYRYRDAYNYPTLLKQAQFP